MRAAAMLVPLVLLGGCATIPGNNDMAQRDPYEKFNRGVWGVNQTLDRIALKPAASVYRTITPAPARRGITHVFSNLTEPLSFVNNMLQLKPKRALRNLGRFVVNLTVGVGGLADQATKIGIKPANEDFGQTFARYGVSSGPYLMLPLLGPSTLRDGIGTGVAFVADPYRICLNKCTNLSTVEKLGISAVALVSARSDLTESGADSLLKSSLDSYATVRSAFLQRRTAEIADKDNDDAAGGGSSDAAVDAAIKDAEDEAKAQGGDATPPAGAAPTSPTPAPTTGTGNPANPAIAPSANSTDAPEPATSDAPPSTSLPK